MPVEYYHETTKKARELVRRKDLDGIRKYITSEVKDQELLAHHIGILAVAADDLQIIEHIRPWLNVSYSPDGNAQSLLVEAVERRNKKMVELLVEIAKQSPDTVSYERFERNLGFFSRQLVREEDIDFIDFMINLGTYLWDLFHYSIAWNHPNLTKYLIENHSDRIKPEWVSSATEIARRFNSQKSLDYLSSIDQKSDLFIYTRLDEYFHKKGLQIR